MKVSLEPEVAVMTAAVAEKPRPAPALQRTQEPPLVRSHQATWILVLLLAASAAFAAGFGRYVLGPAAVALGGASAAPWSGEGP